MAGPSWADLGAALAEADDQSHVRKVLAVAAHAHGIPVETVAAWHGVQPETVATWIADLGDDRPDLEDDEPGREDDEPDLGGDRPDREAPAGAGEASVDPGGIEAAVAAVTGADAAAEAAAAAGAAVREAADADGRTDVGVAVFERDGSVLRPVVATAAYPVATADLATVEDADAAAWRVLDRGTTVRTTVESTPELVVPAAERGVLRAAFVGADAVDDPDPATARELRIVAAVTVDAAAARDRIEAFEERAEHLRRENDRLGDFASIVSHDLRNPLSVARGYLDVAEETGDPGHFEEVRSAHDRIGTIIDHTLTLARDGDGIVDATPVDLGAAAEAAWRNVATADADLTVAASTGLDADEARLKQLLENLFRNAIEHAGPGVEVRVGTLDPDEGFYVADDGPGIPAGVRDRVFDREYTTGGTGLGLSIVREVAEVHGWTVRCEESRTGGARVVVVTDDERRPSGRDDGEATDGSRDDGEVTNRGSNDDEASNSES